MPDLKLVTEGQSFAERAAILRSNVGILCTRLIHVAVRERLFTHILAGGFVFWLPAVSLHVLRGTEFSIFEMVLLTLFLPALITFAHIVSMQCGFRPFPAAVAMVTGIYLLGPSFLMFGTWFSGGGPFDLKDLFWLLVFSIVPFYTLIMATYDGLILAVLLGTAVPLVVGAVCESARERSH